MLLNCRRVRHSAKSLGIEDIGIDALSLRLLCRQQDYFASSGNETYQNREQLWSDGAAQSIVYVNSAALSKQRANVRSDLWRIVCCFTHTGFCWRQNDFMFSSAN